MIKITIEYTAPVRYRLFKLRWLLIALAIFCMVFDILIAALFSNEATRWNWILLAIISLLAIVINFSDLMAHSKSKTPPNSPVLPYRDVPSGHQSQPQQGAASRSTDDTSEYERVESQLPGPSQRGVESEEARANPGDEERIAFLPPPPSESEKSDGSDGNKHAGLPLEPNKIITILDMVLVVTLLAFYVANMVIESIFANFGWGWNSNAGYALKVHAMIGSMVIILLHLHCFWLELKAFRAQKKGGKRLSLRRGVIRI